MTEACKHSTGACACAKIDPAKLHRLSEDQLHLIDQYLEGVIFDVLKVNEQRRIAALEAKLADVMYASFSKKARTAVDRALDVMRQHGERQSITGKWSQADVQAILQPIADNVGELFAKSMATKLTRAAAGIYIAEKKYQSAEFGVRYSTKVVDQLAMRGAATNALYWIGTRYGREIGPRLQAITRDILIQQGLPLRDAASAMADAFEITLGVARANQQMPALSEGVQIPPGFNGSARDYFKGVAAHVRSTSASFGFTQFMVDNNVTWYVLSNPMDEQTTQLCAFLNGKIFRQQDAVNQRGQYLRSNTIEEAKAAMPFTSFKKVSEQVGFTDEADFDRQGMSGLNLAASADIALPPFHFRCRTVAEPIGTTGQLTSPQLDQKPTPKPTPAAPAGSTAKVPKKPVAQAPDQKLRKVPQIPQSEQNWSGEEGINTTPRVMQPVPGWKPHKTIAAAKRELAKFGFDDVRFEKGTKKWNDDQKLYILNILSYEAARFVQHGLTAPMKYLLFTTGSSWYGYFSEGPMQKGYGDVRRTHLAIDSRNKTFQKMYLQPGSHEKRVAQMGQKRWASYADPAAYNGIHVLFRHEVGHTVKYMAHQQSPEIGSFWSRLYAKLGGAKKAPRMKDTISTYSSWNSDELFAELFAIYTSPDFKPGSIDAMFTEKERTLKVHDPKTGKIVDRVYSIEAMIEETLQLAMKYRRGL